MRPLPFLLCFALWIEVESLIYKKNAFLPPLIVSRPGGGLRRTAYWQYIGKSMTDEVTAITTVPQRLDHFNAADVRMWSQVYWLNSQYAVKHDGRDLVFLQVGGDSYESKESVRNTNWQIVKWAQQFGAHIYRVEHRFFDKTASMGVNGTDALKYLTVDQAVEDVAAFAKSSPAVTGLVRPFFIIFGDGYGGILASLARFRHSDIFTAAVVSSAPVHYRREWPEFSTNMQTILGNIQIQSSPSNCDKWMGSFMDNLLKFTDIPGFRKQLNAQLQISPPLPDGEIPSQQRWHFFASVFSVFQAFSPLTYPSSQFTFADQFTAENLCRKMYESNDAGSFTALLNLYKWLMGDNYMDGKPNDFTSWYENTVNNLKFSLTTHVDDDSVQNVRWLWLSCNELGMFPVTSSLPNSIWKAGVPINYYDALCNDVFGNALQPNKNPLPLADKDASNTVFVYGSLDPSRTLGRLTEDPSKNVVVVDIAGVGALADIFSVVKAEPASIATARMKIGNFINGVMPWKSSVSSVKPSPSPTIAPVSTKTTPKPTVVVPTKPGVPTTTQRPVVTNPPNKGSSPLVTKPPNKGSSPLVTYPNVPTVQPLRSTPRPNDQSTKSARGTGLFSITMFILSIMFLGSLF